MSNSLQVFLDATIFRDAPTGGCALYLRELVNRLPSQTGVSIELVPRGIPAVAADAAIASFATGPSGWTGRLRAAAPWAVGPLRSLKKAGERVRCELAYTGRANGLFHSVYHQQFPVRRVPMVATVYDIIFEKFTDMFGSEFDSERLKKAQVVKDAARCIAISGQTKADICDLFGISPAKVDVIPLGVDPAIFSPKAEAGESEFLSAAGLPSGPYLLYVGGRENHKNFSRFLRAYATSRLPGDFPLVVAGYGWSPAEREQVAATGIAGRIHLLVSPTTTELAMLYRNAAVFVYPSLYEGFGLPILEAMSCGTPIALSNAGPCPEVGGDVPAYFDPKDESDIARAIETLLDPREAHTRRARGLERVKSFSWDRTATLTVETYRKALAA
jgi:glycosyltransferase involved in cell wall biosynthesis